MLKAHNPLPLLSIIFIDLQVNLNQNVLIDKNTIIELLYDDDLVSQATDLYESNKVTDLVSLDANIYVCKVLDGKKYEVEIQSPFAKKQKVSCECTFYAQHRICKHIIAGLMLIRAEQVKKQTSKENRHKSQIKQKLSTLNISQVLEEISHEDLKLFVKAYTKRDIKFATQFKVTFARKIDTIDNAEKYRNILNAIVKPHTGLQAKASSSDIKVAVRVLDDFGDQINDSIALTQYREAVDIFRAAFVKLEYIRHHYHYHTDALTSLSVKYHRIIGYFFEEKLPPELRTDLIDFLVDLAFRSYYHYTDVNFNIVKILWPFIKKDDNITFGNRLEVLIQDRSTKERPILMALWLIDYGKYNDASKKFIHEYPLQQIEMIDHLLAAGKDDLALKCLESIHNPKKPTKDILNRLVFLYVRLKKTDRLKETTTQAYLLTGDLKYIDILKKELTEEQYRSFILDLEQELLSQGPHLLLNIYRKEENWSGLVLFLDKTNDISLIMQYDVLLYKHERVALSQLYIHHIRMYLDEHLGESAFDFLKKIKDHFLTHKLDNTLLKVSNFVKENYAHRLKVIEIFG